MRFVPFMFKLWKLLECVCYYCHIRLSLILLLLPPLPWLLFFIFIHPVNCIRRHKTYRDAQMHFPFSFTLLTWNAYGIDKIRVKSQKQRLPLFFLIKNKAYKNILYCLALKTKHATIRKIYNSWIYFFILRKLTCACWRTKKKIIRSTVFLSHFVLWIFIDSNKNVLLLLLLLLPQWNRCAQTYT